MYPRGWHPMNSDFALDGRFMGLDHRDRSRTAVGGVCYYYIDFGISTFNQDATLGSLGQVRAPELSDSVPYDPYKLDVYGLGATFSELFSGVSRSFDSGPL